MAEELQVGDIVVRTEKSLTRSGNYYQKPGYVVAIDPQHNVTTLRGHPQPIAKVVLFGENATERPIPFYFYELKKIG